jgi:NAD(P)-dependent dehydrogenase (short-subunit alcohol dehydrogenase family)
LTGRVIAVTGAASGLGRALAVELTYRGSAVALADVDEDGLRETAAACVGPGAATVHVVDVADASAVDRYAQEALAAHGAVDVLISNAAVQAVGSVWDLTLEDYAWVLGVDLWGSVHGVKAFLPHLLERPEARSRWSPSVPIAGQSGPVGVVSDGTGLAMGPGAGVPAAVGG